MSRGPHLRCGDCHRRDRNGTCLVRAKFMSAIAKACKFGQAEHHRRTERERYHQDNPEASYRKCPECHENTGHGNVESYKTDAQFREMKRCEQNEAQKRRDRMRKRDSAYARWERENGVAPRFEDNGDKLVEIRGQIG